MIFDRIQEKNLIKNIQTGDLRAFGRLVDRHSEQVITLAYRIVSSRQDAEDIAQEVFVRVYKGINNFRGDSSFSTWLYTIVKNACYSFLQKKRPEMISLDKEEEVLEDISEMYQDNKQKDPDTGIDFSIFIEEKMKNLPPKYNLVLQLFYYQQFKYVEIAEILDLPLSTVKTHIQRALKLLRKEVIENNVEKEQFKNEVL
ncbi:RNA polymerase sigma factor [candidate division KSB1 bacterium]